MTFQIITDATADLPESIIAENQLTELNMMVAIDGINHPTSGKNKLTNQKLLEEIAQGKRAVTSAVGVGEAEEVFMDFAKEGKELLYLAFSSGLSGSFQSACIARDTVFQEYPEAKITIIDSLAAASGEGYLVEEAIKFRNQGKSLEETVDLLEDLIPRVKSWLMVDDLDFLAQGGRISKTAALVGTMASIKPVLQIDAKGQLKQVSKIRGSKKVIRTMIENTIEDLDDNYPRVIIAYSGTDEAARSTREEFLKLLPNINVEIRPLGPVITAHTGSGTLAIFSIGKTIRA